jgi:hypothetical protein
MDGFENRCFHLMKMEKPITNDICARKGTSNGAF